MSLFAAIDSSGFVLVAVAVLIVLGIAYGYYSRGRQDINQRPQGGEKGDAPGVGEGSSRVSAAEDETEGTFDSHGMK